MKRISTALAILLTAHTVLASDHIDGPVTMKHRVADLTDLYAFPTPNKPGFLTVILNAYPLMPGQGHYSEKVSYVLTLRKASVKSGEGPFALETAADTEVTVRCSFVTPRHHSGHVATCAASNGFKASVTFNQVKESGGLYAGMRSDPFFFNEGWATAASKDSKLLKPENKNVMDGSNVLALVMELDMSKVFPGGHDLFALAAEAFAQDTPDAPMRRMDRLGRPEITNVSISAAQNTPDLRDQYNLDQPFRVAAAHQNAYRERLAANLAYFDAVDGKKDWADGDRELAASLLADDFLLVDLGKPCDGDAFLEIEKSALRRKAHTTCGGRKLGDDIMDTLFTLYIAGLDGQRLRDGVDQPGRPISPSFPYLAGPEMGLKARTKVFIARKALGL